MNDEVGCDRGLKQTNKQKCLFTWMTFITGALIVYKTIVATFKFYLAWLKLHRNYYNMDILCPNVLYLLFAVFFIIFCTYNAHISRIFYCTVNDINCQSSTSDKLKKSDFTRNVEFCFVKDLIVLQCCHCVVIPTLVTLLGNIYTYNDSYIALQYILCWCGKIFTHDGLVGRVLFIRIEIVSLPCDKPYQSCCHNVIYYLIKMSQNKHD